MTSTGRDASALRLDVVSPLDGEVIRTIVLNLSS